MVDQQTKDEIDENIPLPDGIATADAEQLRAMQYAVIDAFIQGVAKLAARCIARKMEEELPLYFDRKRN